MTEKIIGIACQPEHNACQPEHNACQPEHNACQPELVSGSTWDCVDEMLK